MRLERVSIEIAFYYLGSENFQNNEKLKYKITVEAIIILGTGKLLLTFVQKRSVYMEYKQGAY